MVRILHISDPHAQSETMERLHNLALAQADCDVVALTGDCVSQTCQRVPSKWNTWPQALLLSVPGNHDKSETFEKLGNWQWRPPYIARFEDLIFIGLSTGSAKTVKKEIEKEIEAAGCREWEGCRGVVVLYHYSPDDLLEDGFTTVLEETLRGWVFLFLHGHDHPQGFSGTEWDDSRNVGGMTIFRSRVCSSISQCRGLGNRIEWDGQVFHCTRVRGDR